jgi:hypothetical protein
LLGVEAGVLTEDEAAKRHKALLLLQPPLAA